LLEDRRAAEDGLASSFPLRRGFFLDLADQLGDLFLLLLQRELLPAGQGREGHRLARRETVALTLLSPATRRGLGQRRKKRL
jgi:hypothetical protein